MLRLPLVFGLAAIAFFLSYAPVAAFYLSSSSLKLSPGESATFEVLANNTTALNGVTIHLQFKNLKVTDVTVPNPLLSIGTCSNAGKFTDTEVCVDVAGTQDFTPNQVLAEITVLRPTSSTAAGSITVLDDSMYSDKEKVNFTPLTIDSNGITNNSGTPGSTTANAGTTDMTWLIVLALIVLALVCVGIFLIIWKKSRKGDNEEKSASSQETTSTQTPAPATSPAPTTAPAPSSAPAGLPPLPPLSPS